MASRVVIVGAGGFGRETLDVVEAINAAAAHPEFEILGVIDDAPSEENLVRLLDRRIRYLGTIEMWAGSGVKCSYLVGIGNQQLRSRISAVLDAAGMVAVTAIHPASVIGSQVKIGKGVVICAGAQVSTNVTLKEHVQLNPSVTIGHDTVIDAFVSVNPGAIISGAVHIEEGVLVGAGAVILQGIRVGEGSLIGAGACVVRDVARGLTVKGVPAR